MTAYADTGFLVSLYKEETTSADANSAIENVDPPVLLSDLSVLEFRNALNLAVFRKEISTDAHARIFMRFEADFDAGLFSAFPLPASKLYSESTRLSDTHSATLGTRTLDLMHVASALILGAEVFLSFDVRQRAVAELEKLLVLRIS